MIPPNQANRLKIIAQIFIIIFIILNITRCTIIDTYDTDGAPPNPIDLSHVKEPIPKAEPKSKYGNPESYKVLGKRYYTMNNSKGFKQTGRASWYGTKFHGKKTSSGEPYNMYALTGAHRTLPLPTYARVTNKDNNKSIIVKINDRGPFHDDRIIDLSYAAASKLGVLGKGTAHVELTAIDPNQKRSDKIPKKLSSNITSHTSQNKSQNQTTVQITHIDKQLNKHPTIEHPINPPISKPQMPITSIVAAEKSHKKIPKKSTNTHLAVKNNKKSSATSITMAKK